MCKTIITSYMFDVFDYINRKNNINKMVDAIQTHSM